MVFNTHTRYPIFWAGSMISQIVLVDLKITLCAIRRCATLLVCSPPASHSLNFRLDVCEREYFKVLHSLYNLFNFFAHGQRIYPFLFSRGYVKCPERPSIYCSTVSFLLVEEYTALDEYTTLGCNDRPNT